MSFSVIANVAAPERGNVARPSGAESFEIWSLSDSTSDSVEDARVSQPSGTEIHSSLERRKLEKAPMIPRRERRQKNDERRKALEKELAEVREAQKKDKEAAGRTLLEAFVKAQQVLQESLHQKDLEADQKILQVQHKADIEKAQALVEVLNKEMKTEPNGRVNISEEEQRAWQSILDKYFHAATVRKLQQQMEEEEDAARRAAIASAIVGLVTAGAGSYFCSVFGATYFRGASETTKFVEEAIQWGIWAKKNNLEKHGPAIVKTAAVAADVGLSTATWFAVKEWWK
jgi:hypothetical protein